MVGWIVKKFITHDRDMRLEGIGMLQKAAAHGGITADSALSTLMWIMIGEARYNEAMPIAVAASRRWPKEKHGYWAQGRINLVRWQCAEAKRQFERIADLVRQENVPLDRFPEVEIALELASLCIEGDTMGFAERDRRIRALGGRLTANPNMQLEYANSKGAGNDFRVMLDKIDKQQFILPRNSGKK